MEVAKALLRSIGRAFYPVEQFLIIDALILHSAVRDDDLAYLMSMNIKPFRKVAAKLRDDGLISLHSRQEVKTEDQKRTINRDYFYIDYHKAIDVIKFRLKKMTWQVEKKFGQTPDEKKDYRCPQCKNEYTQMEVLDVVGPQGFECRKCGHLLVLKEDAGQAHTGHEVQSRLNAQLSAFEDLMRQIDNLHIPENTFDDALANAIPVEREGIEASKKSEPVHGKSRLPPQTVRGQRLEPEKIQVSLMGDGQESGDLTEAQKRAKMAQQNVLPVWHAESTVTGAKVTQGWQNGDGKREEDNKSNLQQQLDTQGMDEDDEKDQKKIDMAVDSAVIDKFWADYNRKVAQDEEDEREEEEDEDDEDDEDEDEDDFEDVGFGATTNVAEGSTNNDDEDGPSPSKRVRIQEPNAESATSTPPMTNGISKSENEDSEEEGDFEDAL